MNIIILGAILEAFDYNILINTHSFDILPDFIGFFLIFLGMSRLAGKEPGVYEYMRQGKWMALALTLMAFLDMLMTFNGIGYGSAEIATLKEVLVLLLVYFCYAKLVNAFQHIEKNLEDDDEERPDLRTDPLFRGLTFMLVARVLLFVVVMQGTVLVIPAMLFSVVMNIIFIKNLYQTEKRYERIS